jgi:hypothetical protein
MQKMIIVLFTLLLSACSSSVSDSETAGCDDPEIKGNLTTYNGEKIYHVPGGQFYEVTDAEEMFCSEEEAEAAGFRKSER